MIWYCTSSAVFTDLIAQALHTTITSQLMQYRKSIHARNTHRTWSVFFSIVAIMHSGTSANQVHETASHRQEFDSRVQGDIRSDKVFKTLTLAGTTIIDNVRIPEPSGCTARYEDGAHSGLSS